MLLTLHNTSGLFNHHMWRVVQGGVALWQEKDKVLERGVYWFILLYEGDFLILFY